MKLSSQAVKEFQQLHKAKFHERIDYETAEQEGMQLIRVISMIQPNSSKYKEMGMDIKGGAIKPPESHDQKRGSHGANTPKSRK